MFSNRRSSQKPDEEFYAAFKQSFPNVGPGTTSATQAPAAITTTHQRSASISEAIVDPLPSQRPYDNVEEASKEMGSTPKPFNDQWRLTPSLMDPNSYAFSAFANQPPGYYTPTPGGFNTFYHSSAAGDLHTPGMGMNTPLSMPHSLHALQAQDQAIQYGHFNPQLLHQAQMFHDPFNHPMHAHQQQQQQQQPPPQTFADPSPFLQHQDSGYGAVDDSPDRTTPKQNEMGMMQQTMAPSMQQMPATMNLPGAPVGEKFRYHTTLNAPTAMVRNSDEIPITYLNKGQAYTMSIYDSLPQNSVPGTTIRYRTYVRISFEDEQQRAKPGACWQLWREGRGSNEAHQRGGKLLAVEYVDPNQGGDEQLRKSQIEVERASFDGFVVNWYPNNRTSGAPDCSISVRFNFLSTDFSHSKGVKGIPVRLCAKTELITPGVSAESNEPEVCFAKVKLFRDHGAERKLSNDVAHVKKSIEKLKQQIAQAESGMGNVGKRKRSGSIAKGALHPSRPIKHKRTWSTNSEAEAGRMSAEEDLHMKLVALQDMFSSTRPVSILYLKGEPEDDPDLCPVNLPGGDEMSVLARTQTWESRQSTSDSPTSNAGSPTPSSTSITPKRKFSEIQQTTIQEEDEDDDGSNIKQERQASPSRPVKILKREHETTLQADLLAVDVDSTYKPPIERPLKPVACFYIKDKFATQEYYRAVYLRQRTVKDLINSISEKFQIDPTRVTRVTHVNAKGLHIVVDEDVVREVPEGQDMIVEFSPVKSDEPEKHDFIPTAVTEAMVDGEIGAVETTISDPLEMWLNY